MTIGERINQKRVEHKYSLSKLARIIGVSKTSVQLWEKNVNTPTVDNLQKLEVLLDLGVLNPDFVNKEVRIV